MNRSLLLVIIALTLIGCKKEKYEVTPEVFHKSMKKLTDVIVHDIFSPPVASRVYVYPSIAAFEVMSTDSLSNLKPLKGQLKDFDGLKHPDEKIDHKLASLIAFLEVGKKLIHSTQKMEDYQTQLLDSLENGFDSDVYENSLSYGMYAAEVVTSYMGKDKYNQTRTYPKYAVDLEDEGRWQPTPPDYMDGIEPSWMHIRTLVIDSASQFKPVPPPPFSLNKNSEFYKELIEVYEVVNSIDNEQNDIAAFWDCNPFVSEHKGHFMYATKKITPGGHWINICKIATEKAEANYETTILAYTSTTIALFDAFISCWDEKYRSSLVRPETLINKHIDEAWKPKLQTPPFPEYTSGHSVISAAASVALTNVFGDNFAFTDDSEVEFGLTVREFTSFYHASQEAAISRLYGGIHYRAAIDNGVDQGKKIGKYINDKIQLKK